MVTRTTTTKPTAVPVIVPMGNGEGMAVKGPILQERDVQFKFTGVTDKQKNVTPSSETPTLFCNCDPKSLTARGVLTQSVLCIGLLVSLTTGVLSSMTVLHVRMSPSFRTAGPSGKQTGNSSVAFTVKPTCPFPIIFSLSFVIISHRYNPSDFARLVIVRLWE